MLTLADGILSPMNWYCTHHLPSPRSRLHTGSVPGRSGEYLFGADYEPRVITLTVAMPREFDKSTHRWDLGKYFTLDEFDLLIDPVTYRVKYSGMMDVIEYPYSLVATVPLKMLDPFGYVSKSLTGSGTANNEGNYPTYPTFTIPPSTNPSIQVGTTVLSYSGTVGAGSTLIVDCEKQTAFIGSTNVLKNLSGDFPILSVGNNTVTVPASTVTSWKDLY